jgi:pimeloyl-ACP methyl ester carboxylesterase
MAGMEAATGRSRRDAPVTRLGSAEKTLIVAPGFTTQTVDAEGLVLQGMMRAFEDYLSEYTVIIAGRSEESAASGNIDLIADELLDLIDELGLDPGQTGLVGNSLGGMIVLHAAARAKTAFSGLAVVSAAARLTPEGRELLSQVRALAEQEAWRRVAFLMTAHLFPNRVAATLYGSIAWLVPALFGVPEEPDAFIGLVDSAIEIDLEEELDGVASPVILVAGDQDHFFGPAEVELTAERLADVELKQFPGSGHGLGREKADQIDGMIRRFFRERMSRD